LVVISLLVLFALVGIAFVVYAESQANTSRIWREGAALDQPDMDPEMLLSAFLSQLLYDTDNPLSALRGHGLMRNMYGPPGGTIPFNGTGRQRADPNYYNVDYTNYSGGVPRDPNQVGQPSPNPPYTYPDFNHMYLAAQRAGPSAPGKNDGGQILVPSYYRMGPNGPITLRPNSAYHGPQWQMTDPSGDVKNLADSPGYGNGPNDSIWIDIGFPVMTALDGRKFKPLFAPLVLDLDGRVNVNVHGNIRGGTYGASGGLDPPTGWSLSDQGLGPWEVIPAKVIQAQDDYTPGKPGPLQEARRLFIGNLDANYNQTLRGRYDIKNTPTNGPWGQDWHRLPDQYAITGPFYSPTNGDANYQQMGVCLPGFTPANSNLNQFASATSAFPYYSTNCDGWNNGSAGRNNPMLYNFFMPTMSYYNSLTRGRHFSPLNMESLLRYGDTGTPSQPSEIFQVCPLSFGDPTNGPKARRLVTTHSFDVDQPGVTPWLWNPQPGVPLFTLQQGAPYPIGVPIPPPPPGTIPPNSEFAPAWQALVAGMGRIHVNRDLPKGTLPWYNAMGVAGGPQLQGLTRGRITDLNQAAKAINARQQFAAEIFGYFQALTGATSPANAQPGSPEFNALRWLAQLSVNIVDQIDLDENMTPFAWYQPTNPMTGQPDYPRWQWVFGTELPRLVMNEAYAEIANDPNDPNLQKMGSPAGSNYKVNFWVELYNPLFSGAGKGGQGSNYTLTDNGMVRLQVATGPKGEPAYPVYKITVATPNPNIRALDNVRGAPDPNSIKTEVTSYQAVQGTPTPNPKNNNMPSPVPPDPPLPVRDPPANNNPNLPPPYTVSRVYPVDYIPSTPPLPLSVDDAGGPRTTPGDNKGYFVIAPNASFPNTDPQQKFQNFATLNVQDNGKPAGQTGRTGMSYDYDKGQDPGQFAKQTTHTIFLRRLCCPALPPNVPPTDPDFDPRFPYDPNPALQNPYVTIDYMENVPVNDGVQIDNTGSHMATQTPITQRYSVGKNQPYAGHSSQVKPQKPLQPLTNQPQNTFFGVNVQNIDPKTGNEMANPNNPQQPWRWPFDWLTFIDRPLISPVELLQTSGYKPHELTQQFMLGDPQTGKNDPQGKPVQRFQHLAPWFDQNARIYRVMEYMNATSPMQWVPVGGRCTGQININSIWDVETFRALAGRTPCNYFTDAPNGGDVDNLFNKIVRARSPNRVPVDGDRPFLGLATGNIEDTVFRSDPVVQPAPQSSLVGMLGGQPPFAPQRMFEPEQLFANGPGNKPLPIDHPYIRYELLKKLFNNVKTRSNVFAVWLTVGFFEVQSDGDPNRPPVLGQEIGRAENRHKRHRMFTIVDRSSATIRFDPNGQPLPGPVGQPPFFIPSFSPVTSTGIQLVDVPNISGDYEYRPWQIKPGDTLVIDTGLNQEVVSVIDARAVQPGDMPGNQGPYVIRAAFAKTHTNRFSISNSMLGNPGPQPRFDVRQPDFQMIVRYFDVIE
jgi:hypothetical protein